MKKFYMTIAEETISMDLLFAETASYFSEYQSIATPDAVHVEITAVEQSYWKKEIGSIDPAAEYSLLCVPISDALLMRKKALFHAVAFRHKDKAWLIAAGPGVGKSTQIRTLERLYPEEFSVICGDRPALEVRDDGRILVHPTPWNGKEGWHGAEGCELGGIILLERGEKNVVESLPKLRSILPVSKGFISSLETEVLIQRIAEFETAVLENVPVWRFVNEDIPESTKLLYETVFRGR